MGTLRDREVHGDLVQPAILHRPARGRASGTFSRSDRDLASHVMSQRRRPTSRARRQRKLLRSAAEAGIPHFWHPLRRLRKRQRVRKLRRAARERARSTLYTISSTPFMVWVQST